MQILDMPDEEFAEWYKGYKAHKVKLNTWVIVQETEHSCPDCAATLRVVIERLPATGQLRTAIEHVRHNV